MLYLFLAYGHVFVQNPSFCQLFFIDVIWHWNGTQMPEQGWGKMNKNRPACKKNHKPLSWLCINKNSKRSSNGLWLQEYTIRTNFKTIVSSLYLLGT